MCELWKNFVLFLVYKLSYRDLSSVILLSFSVFCRITFINFNRINKHFFHSINRTSSSLFYVIWVLLKKWNEIISIFLTISYRQNIQKHTHNISLFVFVLGSRQRWTPLQKEIMRKNFRTSIQSKRALRKQECVEFLNKYQTNFVGVEWLRVKTFIYNECKLSLNK